MSGSKRQDAAAKQNTAAVAVFYIWLLGTMLLWAFALYPISNDAPQWLVRSQAICFGRTASGLPDAGGWILLIAAPLSLLAALFVAMGTEIKAGIQSATHSKSGAIFLGLVACLFVTQAAWAAQLVRERLEASDPATTIAREELPENYPRLNDEVANFFLIDQAGNRRSLQELRGKAVILSFVFAHCETVCPAIVATSKAALRSLPEDQTALLLVTLDPWRDTPSSLPALAKKWNIPHNAALLSGTVEEVQAVLTQFKVPSSRDLSTGDISHPALVYLLDRNGSLAYAFNNPSSAWIVEGVHRITNG